MIVVTTRDADPAQWGPWCRLHRVDRLTRDDAVVLLRTLAPHAGRTADAAALADRLDRLPLALRLAGSYLHQTHRTQLPGAATTYATYLDFYQHTINDTNARPDTEPALTGIRQSVETSLRLLDLRGTGRARTLLQILAQFALASISTAWLDITILGQHPHLTSLTIAELQGLLDALHQLDLIAQSSTTITLHQHIHDVGRSPDPADPSRPVAAALLGAAIKADHDLYDPAGWPTIDAAAPHLLALLDRSAVPPGLLTCRSITVAARIVISCQYHRTIITAPAAVPLLERVITAQQRLCGHGDRDTLRTRNNLGFVLMNRGNLDPAEQEFQAVLEARRRLFGDDDRETLRIRNNLADLWRERGDFDAAEREYRVALEAQQRLFGDDGRDIVGNGNNLTDL